MYSQLYSAIVGKVTEGFQGGESPAGVVLVGILAVIVTVAIQLYIVRFLWNHALAPSVTIVRPLKSLLQTLGVVLLFAVIHPGCAVASAP
jgi:hypothetical protein